MLTVRRCAACGSSIAHKRRGAECCSSRCRAALSRRRKRTLALIRLPVALAVGRPACGRRHAGHLWWRSRLGPLVCGTCHPPAHLWLVIRWERAA